MGQVSGETTMLAPSGMIGRLLGANLNTTSDQAIAIFGPSLYVLRRIIATNASTTLAVSTAAGGLYTGAAKSGTTVVAAGQVYTALTGASKFVDLTLALTTDTLTAQTLYFALSITNGSAATCDLYLIGDVLA